jgi:hypothetical protein
MTLLRKACNLRLAHPLASPRRVKPDHKGDGAKLAEARNVPRARITAGHSPTSVGQYMLRK